MLVETTAMYLTIDVLPAAAGPGRIVRRPGKTLVALSSMHTRLRVGAFCVDNLEPVEMQAMMDGWGFGSAAPDWTTEPGAKCLLYVPPALRLRGDSAIQGGAELPRRWRVNGLAMELGLLAIERNLAAEPAAQRKALEQYLSAA